MVVMVTMMTCDRTSNGNIRNIATTGGTCDYTAQTMTYKEAQARCNARGKELCDFSSVDKVNKCGGCCNYDGWYWYGRDTTPCSRALIVDAEGRVALKRKNEKMYHTLTYFRVHWSGMNGSVVGSAAPNAIVDGCRNGFCKVVDDKCYCQFTDETTVAFTSLPFSKDIVTKRLHVGGVPPTLLEYVRVEQRNGMRIYFTNDSGRYDTTMFEIMDGFGRSMYLKNVEKTVKLLSRQNGRDSGSDKYTFRNPPHFVQQFKPELRDAEYETEATLDHYFYHPNTAPFISYRLLQRFGHSNPSPRFVQAVSEAFKSGTYIDGTYEFGSGAYGDLAATMACILLDRETSSVVLDADPTHGSIQEPLLKFI